MNIDSGFSFRKLFIMLLDRRISQAELAEKAGVSQASISRLKNNEAISMKSLHKICNALECRIEDIMENQE